MPSLTAPHFFPHRIPGFFFVILSAILCCLFTSHIAGARPLAPAPVTINFDSLPAGVVVSNQYPQVTFFSPTGYYGDTLYTAYDYNVGGSYPNGLISRFNNCSTCGAMGDVYLDFPIPVNNFSFYILNSHWPNHPYQPMLYIDVFVSGAYYGTYTVNGNWQPGQLPIPIYVDKLKSISNITNIRIRDVGNTDYNGYQHHVYYDDFSFTPGFDVSITNPRVSGSLNNTTQGALLAGDVKLQANLTPANLTGGTYSWSITGPNQIVSGAANQPLLTVRWTETGTYTAKVSYTRNGFTACGTVTVNVVLPTLTSFTAAQSQTLIGRAEGCANTSNLFLLILGCPPFGNGIDFSATAHIPATTYISDPTQLGIKYVQAVSTIRKVRHETGRVECLTGRSSENNVDSGWRLDSISHTDGGDPYEDSPAALRYFSQGNSLTILTNDSPAQGMNIHEAIKVDDRFQMYVVYFAGSNPRTPYFQRRLGSLTWNWGAQMVYDAVTPDYSSLPYRVQDYYAPQPGISRQQDPVTSTIVYQGFNSDLNFGQCPGEPPPTQNPIDGSRFFVQQQYLDLLNRPADQGGSNFWTTQITRCAFDNTCIYGGNGDYGKRTLVAREFFNSGEFQQNDPAMSNPPGTPGFNPSVYNPAFVRHCYLRYLRREPDSGGLNFWVDILNRTGDYNGMIYAFISSGEYRQRFGPP